MNGPIKHATPDEPHQLSLLQGFPTVAAASPGPELAARLPVARVRLESSLPHLDRPFDYSVPAALDAAAQPGVRVKVKFNGQELAGYLMDRAAESDAGHPLVPLYKVLSPVPVLTAAVAELAGRVAARYAGNVSDVLRVAVPPRMAKLEKELAAEGVLDPSVFADEASGRGTGAALPGGLEGSRWSGYRNGPAFLQHLNAGESPRAVLSALQGYGAGGWPRLIAEAVAAVRLSGRGAIVVVPDYRDLDRAETALLQLLPAGDVARLTADDGQTPRYRSFLRILSGAAGVAVGTRSAAYAPVHNLGLVVCWDDGDDLHIEQRSPYAHTREVLLLRAEQEGAACLLAAHTRSTETQRLVEAGWARSVEAGRSVVRRSVPRVLNTADSYELEHDPLARIARLPGAAWRAAKDGLERGPVLVQVARAGYAPSLACENCREPARCTSCSGPLAIAGASGSSAVPQCRWCSTPAADWRCGTCNGTRLRRGATGALRTAEELGRAFPGKPVVTSSGDRVLATVPDSKALVVATVGAEPVAPGGYAAALLLDGDSLLRRENLRAGEDAVRRWFNAAALVRPAGEGGLVVITADDAAGVGALLRWDPAGYAERELSLRQELQLPPAVRVASLTGGRTAVGHFSQAVEQQLAAQGITLRTAGPAPLVITGAPAHGSVRGAAGDDVRTLMFIPYGQAAHVTMALRAVKAAAAAKRTDDPVQLRLDGVDVL
ncbi:primosomal protein N' [Arthrobacter sp. AL08]|uniref:primosomal protein N' n=1 Tax=unclassified Arthrobacter TaxID=235627 RepID=UPI001CFF5F1E|nr:MULTISPECIES: primosomal protein N' [unclassified Arthrobacter]MCB5282548.1 putative primosomal protein N' [Arthrobacter sp. ES1]MDI3242875.1 primosomal protein N' [Arthrobacter sp. AL05]MDI3278862.1 primosomal protein N' [Arthrobacter sp. AL08]WGZ81216.1 primosomal protein N' [Arthrobacter sp. EM1]